MGHQPRKMLGAGAAPPAFKLNDLKGRPAASEKILEDGPALLFFFKVGCPVCQMTAPYIERLASGETANHPVRVIGVSQDDAQATEAFNQRFGVTFPVLLDESRSGYPASNGFAIATVPSLFLIEPDGKISTAFSGFSKRDMESLGQRMGVTVFQPDEQVPAFRAG